MNSFVINKDSLKKAWGADSQYWFSVEDYVIKEDIDFLCLSLSEDMERDEIMNLDEFIPYFTVKRSELAKAYVESLKNEKVKAEFNYLDDDGIVEYFWKCFHAYPELFRDYEKFQNDYILCGLKKWCEENNINYTVEL